MRVAGLLARKVFTSLWDRNLYIGGAVNIFDQPEFGDITTIKALLRTFEEKRQLIELLTLAWQGLLLSGRILTALLKPRRTGAMPRSLSR